VKDARLYLVSPARLAAGDLASLIPGLAEAGVDVVQLREKQMEAGDLLREGGPIRDACRAAGIPFIVNDRPDVALALEADGVHLGQNDLPVDVARRILPRAVIGRSTHARVEIDAALTEPIDYIGVGPVHETPTKAGRPGTGLELVRYAAETITLPWFVTGGMSPETLPETLEAGARRIVVVRAIVDAPDPIAATERLKGMLL
jgi:thiamine-phosphate pyrophosphorylase